MAIARLGAKAKDYSSAIVNILIAEHESTRPVPSLAVAGPVKNIEERIKTMLRPGKKFYKRPSLIVATIVLLIALITVPTAIVLTAQAESKTTEGLDSPPIDPNIIELGRAVRKRLTTYSDENIFTLKDGQTGRMKVKENITPVAEILITPNIVADGTRFDLEGVDATGKAIEGTKTTSLIIHDAVSMRMGLGRSFSVGGQQIICKIQLTPERRDDDSVVIEVKALFAQMPTPEEIDAMLAKRGKEGQLQLNYRNISQLITQYKQRHGRYPESLRELNQTLPKDVYSPSGEDYHYESDRKRFILSSCGKDGIYGNDDDEIFIVYYGGARSGQRYELYPLEEGEKVDSQTETVGQIGRRPKGNCSIGGKVASEETGEPVGHAKVYLFYPATFGAIFIDVASDGSFLFKDIPAGNYSLRTVHTSGFQDAIYNPEGKPGEYPEFSLKDGEKRTDVVLKAKPAYSISGRVLDENGEPLRDRIHWVLAWVELNEPDSLGTRYRIAEQTRVTVDGSYLLDGLDGRPVYVMAIDWKSPEKDEFYPPCYYPGTVDRNKAKKVHFDKAKSVEKVDIRLQKKNEFTLEGTVTDDSTGNPIAKALVTVHHRDMLFDRVTAYTDGKGYYQIESLGAGAFLVHIDAEHAGFVKKRKPITIDESVKINHLNVALKPGVTIHGKIVDENGNEEVEIGPRAYGLAHKSGYPYPETQSWSGARNKYSAKGRSHNGTFNGGEGDYEEEYMDFPTPGSFIIEGMIPGKTTFRFHPKTEGQIVKEILYKDQNIMESGIETKPGQEIKDVTIVIGTR